MDSGDVRQKRRTLVDALLAIYGVSKPMVSIDAQLADNLERAWDDYDRTLRETAGGEADDDV